MSTHWSSHEELKKQEENKVGVYDCYDRLLQTGNNDYIREHNAIGDTASYVADVYAQKLQGALKAPYRIADVGSGVGELAHSLKQRLPKAKIDAFELSHSAVAYGKEHYPDVTMHQELIETDKPLSTGIRYQALVCHEFYPFTRCDDAAMHAGMLRSFLASLAPEGMAIITGTEVGPSLERTFTAVREALGPNARLWRTTFPHKKLVARLGPGLAAQAGTMLLSPILTRVLGKTPMFCIHLSHA